MRDVSGGEQKHNLDLNAKPDEGSEKEKLGGWGKERWSGGHSLPTVAMMDPQ